MEKLNGNQVDDKVTVKLLCGADLLESFATPGLWSDEDVSLFIVFIESWVCRKYFLHELSILAHLI